MELTKIQNIKSLIDEDTLIEKMKQFYIINKRAPCRRDFVGTEYPSCSTYMRAFGSWNNALHKAELYDKKRVIKKEKKYTDKELIDFLVNFYNKNNRPPAATEFSNNSEIPHFSTYQSQFGSWSNALKLANIDSESMIKKGQINNSNDKARIFEIKVTEHFNYYSIDLSGQNCNAPFDGICPNGQIYDAKSSALHISTNKYKYKRWQFNLSNYFKNRIKWYYLGAFNEDYTKLLHVWRIPEEIVMNKLSLTIYENQINNFKQYEITENFKEMM